MEPSNRPSIRNAATSGAASAAPKFATYSAYSVSLQEMHAKRQSGFGHTLPMASGGGGESAAGGKQDDNECNSLDYYYPQDRLFAPAPLVGGGRRSLIVRKSLPIFNSLDIPAANQQESKVAAIPPVANPDAQKIPTSSSSSSSQPPMLTRDNSSTGGSTTQPLLTSTNAADNMSSSLARLQSNASTTEEESIRDAEEFLMSL